MNLNKKENKVDLDFSAMEKAVGGSVEFEKTMGPYNSSFTPGQVWVQGKTTVDGLTYGSIVLAVDAETGLVLGAWDEVAPGMAYTVSFTAAEEIHGRRVNKKVGELFNADYHYREYGDGRDTRSATERFGRLD